MKSEMNSNQEVLSYRIRIRKWFQVSGVGLWPGGPIVGLEGYRRESVPERFQVSI
jgi:hypothetical protein